jgi:hypothetical protein
MVVIEGDTATWPNGQTAKITTAGGEFVLQFEENAEKYYAALRPEDGALCWNDNAVWTRISAA